MKKTFFYLILTSISLLFSSCTVSPNLNEADKILIKQEIMETLDNYVKHVNSVGLKGVDNYFSKDERFYWVEDGLIQYPNHKALLKGIEEFATAIDSVNFQTINSNINILTENSAMLYVEYKQDLKLTSGYKFTLDGAMTILILFVLHV